MKIIYKSLIIGFIAVLLYCCIFIACVFFIPDAYKYSSSKGFVRQCRSLQNGKENSGKIIVFGGSYIPFGINIDLLSKLSSKQVYTLGVNAGMGIRYMVETLKPCIKENDIVVMPLTSFNADYYGMETIFIALDGEYDLLFDFIKQHPTRILVDGHIWIVTKFYGTFVSSFIEKLRSKYKLTEKSVNAYSISNYDENGNYILKSYECICSQEELMQRKYLNSYDLTDKEISFINDLADFCNHKNAKLLVTHAPMYKGYYTNTHEQFLEEENKLKQLINADFISDIESCLYPVGMIYNGIAHLNSYGQEHYTTKLYKDLVAHGLLVECD